MEMESAEIPGAKSEKLHRVEGKILRFPDGAPYVNTNLEIPLPGWPVDTPEKEQAFVTTFAGISEVELKDKARQRRINVDLQKPSMLERLNLAAEFTLQRPFYWGRTGLFYPFQIATTDKKDLFFFLGLKGFYPRLSRGLFSGEGRFFRSTPRILSPTAPTFGEEDAAHASLDWGNSEKLYQESEGKFRTSLPVAVIDISGEKEAKTWAGKRVLNLREFKVPFRLSDLTTDFEEKLALARQIIARELIYKKVADDYEIRRNPKTGVQELTPESYALWFTRTMGKQLALAKDLGYIHGNITQPGARQFSNITLGAEIVDHDTGRWEKPGTQDDQLILAGITSSLTTAALIDPTILSCYDLPQEFYNSYRKHVTSSPDLKTYAIAAYLKSRVRTYCSLSKEAFPFALNTRQWLSLKTRGGAEAIAKNLEHFIEILQGQNKVG